MASHAFSKQFTLEQLYKPNVVIVPQTKEQAIELLTWFETTGLSNYQLSIINESPLFSEYPNTTYYNLYTSTYGYIVDALLPYRIIHWKNIPDSSALEGTTMPKQIPTIEVFLKDNTSAIALHRFEHIALLNTLLPQNFEYINSKEKFFIEQDKWGNPLYFQCNNSWTGKSSPGNVRTVYELSDFMKADVSVPQNSTELINPNNTIFVPENPSIWINPKPNKPNTQPITVGSLCLVHDYPFPLTCIEISDNFYTLLKPDSVNVVFDNPKEIYPLTKLKDNTDLHIGDILKLSSGYTIVTDFSNYITYTEHYRPNYPVNGAEADRLKLIQFTCGTLYCTTTDAVITDPLPDNIPTTITKVHGSYIHHQIQHHYSITKLQAKDEELFKELQIALDHPLNVEFREFALLVGPSGSGKTELAIQYANSRNLPYIKMQITAQTTVDDYIGYKSITTGEYFPSLMREAVEKGYTLILDELDAGNPNSTLVLNGLKQSHFQFPDKLVEIHPNFRLIATANTLEYSELYNSRMPMDKATLDRFHIINYTMEDHHLALRYGLEYLKQIDTKNKTPRQIEREVRQLKIHEELKQTGYYN